MATSLKSAIQRQVDTFQDRGRPVVVKITQEGIYIKRKGEHWASAVLCPWAAAFSAACKIKAMESKEQKAVRRVRRGLL